MAIWIVSGVISVVLTAGMTFLFVIFSMIGLNGFTSGRAALPYYLGFNCVAWPIMVTITGLSSWVVFAVAKRPSSRKQLLLMNTIIVTIALGGIMLVALFVD